MPMPKFEGVAARKPIAYDPARRRFVLPAEVVSGQEPFVPVERLTEEELKALVTERIRRDPGFAAQAMSGPLMTGEAVIRAIEQGEPFGRQTLEAERSYLAFLHQQIAEARAAAPKKPGPR